MDARPIAIITGGGRPWGLGRAVALALAEAGMGIVIADIRADWGAETVGSIRNDHGTPATFVATDVANRTDVAAMVERTVAEFGRIDALVNTAAVVENQSLEEITDAHIEHVLGINLVGTILTCQAVAPVMRARGSGIIVNFASGAVVRPLVGAGVYSASKGAVVSFTRVLALELATDGIVALTIAPGAMGNAMGSEHGPTQVGDIGPRHAASTLPRQPFGSFPTPGEIAELVAYVVTSRSTVLAGQVLHANAGALMV